MLKPESKDRRIVHGVLMAVFGRGVMIVGPSGSGKSDLALGLLDRGHALVADDAVRVEHRGDALLGSAPETTDGILAVRGLGLIDVVKTFGDDAYLPYVQIERLVELGSPSDEPAADPFSDELNRHRLCGKEIPCIQIDPARSDMLPLIVETWLRLKVSSCIETARAVRSAHDSTLVDAGTAN